jgi:hypothetical protein
LEVPVAASVGWDHPIGNACSNQVERYSLKKIKKGEVMAKNWSPLTDEEKSCYMTVNKENLEFLMNRYNKVNRWVIADMIRRSAYRYPDKPALIYGDKTMTYAELERECNRTANALTALGVRKYDRVAILAHNTIHHVLTWIGCAKIGAIYLAINYLLRGKDISYCINHSESKVFIVEDALYDLVKDVMDDMPTVKTFIWSNQVAGQPPVSDRFQNFDDWYGKYDDAEQDVILHIEDPCQMTYTSGTESLPKGVIISNQALMAQYMGAIVDGQYDEDDINVNALPIYHCAQRDVFMNPIFWVGGTNILMMPDIAQILKKIGDHKATMFFAPPDGLDRYASPPGFRQDGSFFLEEGLLRGFHYAHRNPQGADGTPSRSEDIQLLRPDGIGALPHHSQGQGCPCQDRFRGHGRVEHGNPPGGRRWQARPRAGCSRRDLRQGASCPDHVLQGTGKDGGGHEGRLVPLG